MMLTLEVKQLLAPPPLCCCRHVLDGQAELQAERGVHEEEREDAAAEVGVLVVVVVVVVVFGVKGE